MTLPMRQVLVLSRTTPWQPFGLANQRPSTRTRLASPQGGRWRDPPVSPVVSPAPPWQPHHRQRYIGEMDSRYELRVVERSDGRWIYRLVVVGADDPSAWESDGKSYLEREDAE